MKTLYPLFGIVTVLNTPFTRDNKIDFPGLRKNVQYAIQSGVAGMLVPAMASEVTKLTRQERSQIVGAVLEETDGRVPIIGGAAEIDPEQRKFILDDLLSIGCQNVLLQIPFENEKQYKRQVDSAAELGFEMMMLQDWDFKGSGLPLDLIVELFETIDTFRCLKIETIPAGIKYSEVLKATDGRLHVSGGWAVMQMIEGLQRGVHAFMPTGMHEIYVQIYRLYQQGDLDKARGLFDQLLPVLAFSNQHLDISVHFFKRLLWKQGIYETPGVRQPILSFDGIHEKLALELIDRVITISTSLA